MSCCYSNRTRFGLSLQLAGMGLTGSGFAQRLAEGSSSKTNNPGLCWCCTSWLPAPPAGNCHPRRIRMRSHALAAVLNTTYGIKPRGRKARAQTAGYELALSLRHSESGYTNFVREHSSCNALRYSCCSLGEGDLSLALLHVAETLRSQQSILLVHLKLTSGVAIQMLMRHPRPLLYLEVPGGRDTVCSPSTIWGRDDSVQ